MAFSWMDFSIMQPPTYVPLENDIAIWRHCSAVIGSPSGATHVPSIIFSKPTLYLGYPWCRKLAQWHCLDFHQSDLPTENFWLLAKAEKNSASINLQTRLEIECELGDEIFDELTCPPYPVPVF